MKTPALRGTQLTYFLTLRKEMEETWSPWSEQFRYTGLDRINSELGYTVENIQPCCKWCNMAKSDRSEKDFIEWVALIIDNWGKVF